MGEGGKFKVRTTSAKGDATEVKSNMMWQEKEDQGGSPLFPSHSIETYSSLLSHPISLPILSPFLALRTPACALPPYTSHPCTTRVLRRSRGTSSTILTPQGMVTLANGMSTPGTVPLGQVVELLQSDQSGREEEVTERTPR